MRNSGSTVASLGSAINAWIIFYGLYIVLHLHILDAFCLLHAAIACYTSLYRGCHIGLSFICLSECGGWYS